MASSETEVAVPQADMAPLFKLIEREVRRQHEKYGPFTDDIGGVRLAVAALEDEVAETREAWRKERRIDHWGETHCEALQVAAVAVRLLMDTGLPERSGAWGAPSFAEDDGDA